MLKQILIFFMLFFWGIESLQAQNIGVGTSTPTARLNVEGTGTTTEVLRVSNDKNATKDSVMVMLANGNIGIGTSIPSSRLNINGNGLANEVFRATNDKNATIDSVMVIKASGRVGIGTTNPAAELNIEGIGSTSQVLRISNDKNTTLDSIFVIEPNGNVGIGTSTPTASAILALNSSTKGFLMPRMTTVQRDAIVSPAIGLIIFNLDDRCVDTYTGVNWRKNCSNTIDTLVAKWTQMADFGGIVRQSAVGFSIGSKGYIGTGVNLGTYLNDFWEYNPINNVWTQKANFAGSARQSAVGFDIGNKGYIGTGFDGANKNDFYEYDPTTNAWTAKANFGGSARTSAVGFSIAGKGYIGTGVDAATTRDFYEYDPITNLWEPKANFLGVARSSAVGFSIGNKGFIGLGKTTQAENDFYQFDPYPTMVTVNNSGAEVINTGVWIKNYDKIFNSNIEEIVGIGTQNPNPSAILDLTSSSKGFLMPRLTTNQRDAIESPATGLIIFNLDDRCVDTYTGVKWRKNCSNIIDTIVDKWFPKADFGGTGRYFAVGFSIGSRGYVGTGFDGANKNDFWEYNSATNVWTQKANFGGTARQQAVGFKIGSKGYVGTGFDTVNKNDFWEYDPSTNVWTAKANFGGTARRNAVGFGIGTKGYVGTGFDTVNKNDFWEYDPSTNVWTAKANFGGTARRQAIGFGIGTKGYIGTGFDTANKNDFWEYDPDTNLWTAKANFGGTARRQAVGFGIGTRGYVGTGIDSANKNDFYEYDAETNMWDLKTNFIGSARNSAIGFSIGSKGYIGLGLSTQNENDFYQFDPFPTRITEDNSGAEVISGGVWTKAYTNVYNSILSDSVGIGTTNPVSKLHVNGDITANIIKTSFISSPIGILMEANEFETARFVANPPTPAGITTPTNRLVLTRQGTSGSKWDMASAFQLGSYADGINANTQLDIALNNGPTANPTIKVMSLLGNGNIGIGEPTPLSKLDINGSLAVGAAFSGTTAAPTNGAIIEGRVGIGTNNPDKSLVILNTSTTAFEQVAELAQGFDPDFQLIATKGENASTNGAIMSQFGLQYNNGTIVKNNAMIRFHRGSSTTGGYMSFVANDNNLVATIGHNQSFTATSTRWFNHGTDLNLNPNGAVSNVAIKAEGTFWANGGGFYATSDERIKNEIKSTDNTADLDILNKIKISDYKFIDRVSNNNKNQKKVIAQQIQSIYPDAVSINVGIIPNVYQVAQSVEIQGNISQVVTEKKHDFKVGDKVKIILEDGGHKIVEVKTVKDEHTFGTEEVIAGKIFVYGKEVSDLLSVDYDALMTLNISATQELHKRIQVLEINNKNLEANNKALEANNNALKAHFEAKFEAIDKALNSILNPLVSIDK
jgi:hypothetical protein